MSRVGFSVGLAGQEAKPTAILGLFTHGVSMGAGGLGNLGCSRSSAEGFSAGVTPACRRGDGNRDFVSPISRVWDFGRRYLYGFLVV